jgi:hypothetical protein
MASNDRTRAEFLVTFLLRLAGAMICCSVFAIFISRDLMDQIAVRLTLAHLPHHRLFEYLTRTLSALYFAHGLVNLLVSLDVRRYRAFVALLGFSNLFFGAVFTWVDLRAPMPMFWTLAEGPPIFVFGLLLLALHRGIRPMIVQS